MTLHIRFRPAEVKNPAIHRYQLGTAPVLARLGAPGSSPGIRHTQDSGPSSETEQHCPGCRTRAVLPAAPLFLTQTGRLVSPKPINTSLDKTTPTAGVAAVPALERTSDAEEDGNCVVQGEVQGAQG